jgi:hypothetical protein
VDDGVEAEEDRLPLPFHEYSVPVLTTGDGGWSPHRLLTMAAYAIVAGFLAVRFFRWE